MLWLTERVAQLLPTNHRLCRFLDCRGTGVTRAALAPLERRFGLVFIQGAVLSGSNAAAAAVVNCDAVACRCGLPPGGPGGLGGGRAFGSVSGFMFLMRLRLGATRGQASRDKLQGRGPPSLSPPRPAPPAAGTASLQATPELQGWEAAGVQLLLHFDPAAGIAGLLEPERRPLSTRPGSVGQAAAAAPAGPPPSQGRRTGYRQPR